LWGIDRAKSFTCNSSGALVAPWTRPYLLVLYVNPPDTHWQIALRISQSILYPDA
jgi:hypothetical protein